MTRTTITRGAKLGLLATIKEDGIQVDLGAGSYTVASALVLVDGDGTRIDLGAVIDNDGKLRVEYDTVNMAAGEYIGDARITNDANGDRWSEKFSVCVDEPSTPPSTRTP